MRPEHSIVLSDSDAGCCIHSPRIGRSTQALRLDRDPAAEGEEPPETPFYRTLPPEAPPSSSPERGTVQPPSTLIDNTAKCGVQDEAKLRSTTLHLYLTFHPNPLIHAT
jgi:hypothetical protein